MSTSELNRGELLDDSEATLRQVKTALSGLWDDYGISESETETERTTEAPSVSTGTGNLPKLIHGLIGAYSEIMGIVEGLRQSRGILEDAAMDRLQTTNRNIKEVSSATELAATGMLDGLERSLDLVNRLDEGDADERQQAEPGASDQPVNAGIRDELKDELHHLINLLQFQDITAQQLGYASGVLTDIEERLVKIAAVFDMAGLGTAGRDEPAQAAGNDAETEGEDTAAVCDPHASTLEADDRQAIADEIFTV